MRRNRRSKRSGRWANCTTGSPAGRRPGRAALLVKLLPQPPIGEVGKADDPLPAHPQHVGQHPLDVQDGLQGLREDDEIELLVGEGGQSLVQVGLDDVQSAADAGDDRPFVQFNAHDPPMSPPPQLRQEPPAPQPRSNTLAPAGISPTIES